MCITSTEINATCTPTVQSVKHSNKTILYNWKYSERCILLLQLHPALCMEAHRVRTYPASNVNAIYILFLFFFFPIRNWYLKQTASCNNHYAQLNAKRNTNAPARSPGRQQEGTAEPLRPPEARTATPAKQGKKGTQRTFHAGATPGRPQEVATPHPLPARLYTVQPGPSACRPTRPAHPSAPTQPNPTARPTTHLHNPNRRSAPRTASLNTHSGVEVTHHWPGRPPRLARSSHVVPEHANASGSRRRGEATSGSHADGCRAIFNAGKETSGSRLKPCALSRVVLYITTETALLPSVGPAPSALTAPAAADGAAALAREVSGACRPPYRPPFRPRAARRSAAILNAGAALRLPLAAAAACGVRDVLGCA